MCINSGVWTIESWICEANYIHIYTNIQCVHDYTYRVVIRHISQLHKVCFSRVVSKCEVCDQLARVVEVEVVEVLLEIDREWLAAH